MPKSILTRCEWPDGSMPTREGWRDTVYLVPTERLSGNETIHGHHVIINFGHAHRLQKWRPTERQLLKCLVS